MDHQTLNQWKSPQNKTISIFSMQLFKKPKTISKHIIFFIIVQCWANSQLRNYNMNQYPFLLSIGLICFHLHLVVASIVVHHTQVVHDLMSKESPLQLTNPCHAHTHPPTSMINYITHQTQMPNLKHIKKLICRIGVWVKKIPTQFAPQAQ